MSDPEREAGTVAAAKAAIAERQKTRKTTKRRDTSAQYRAEREAGTVAAAKAATVSTPRTVKAEPIHDLTADIEQMKSDVETLQQREGTTRRQQETIKEIIADIEKTKKAIKKKSDIKIKEIRATAAKIEKLKKDIPIAKKLTEDQLALAGVGASTRTWASYKTALENIQKASDHLYDRSGFPSKEKVKKYLEEKKPATGFVSGSPFAPKTVEEFLARIGYVTTQATIGGVQEITFPASWSIAKPKRESDIIARMVGGILTPSPLDYAAMKIMSKLTKTVKGSKLLAKFADEGAPQFTAEEARMWEKIKGKSGYSTEELRAAGRKVFRKIDDMAEYYKKYPERATAGAAVIPEPVQEYWDLIDDLGWDDEYILTNYLKKNIDDISAPVLTNMFLGLTDTGRTQPVTKPQLDSYVDRQDKYVFQIPKKGEILDLKPDLSVEPVEVLEEEQIPTVTPKTTPKQIPKPEPVIITEPAIEEPLPPEEVTPTPIIPKTKREKEKLRRFKLQLFNGPKTTFKVRFDYPRGPSQTLMVEARSFVEALNKAQRKRRSNKYHPSLVDITKVKG